MNLWNVLGVSPQEGIVGASIAAVAALLLAMVTVRRRARERPRGRLDLFDR
jgi:ABC-type nitrate/sulfonate/bicarbonate transport system permease component